MKRILVHGGHIALFTSLRPERLVLEQQDREIWRMGES